LYKAWAIIELKLTEEKIETKLEITMLNKPATPPKSPNRSKKA
jgi:hypothetical protein